VYDALTSRYGFSCPVRGETSVTLSAFRSLEALAGTSHPVVYRVTFACGCGGEHAGLVTHEELDWAPLGFGGERFFNLMTAQLEDVSVELSDLAARRIQAGSGRGRSSACPRSGRVRSSRPAFFLSLRATTPWASQSSARSARATSVNLVTHSHVDLPFHNDPEIGVVRHVFWDEPLEGGLAPLLASGDVDGRRLGL
jgi:hypothetical protein